MSVECLPRASIFGVALLRKRFLLEGVCLLHIERRSGSMVDGPADSLLPFVGPKCYFGPVSARRFDGTCTTPVKRLEETSC